jgi:hypothetical protein
MRIEFGSDDINNIICPACDGENLHHDTVTVFDRGTEESPTTATVIERGSRISTITGAQAERSNPSSRRHGITIRFWCEHCAAVSELTVAQHKGCTLLDWRPVSTSVAKVW